MEHIFIREKVRDLYMIHRSNDCKITGHITEIVLFPSNQVGMMPSRHYIKIFISIR